MKEISYLTFKEAKKHDEYLIQQGYSIEALIKTAGQRINNWIDDHLQSKPLVGIIGKGNNGRDVLEAFSNLKKKRNCYLLIANEKIKKSPQYKNLMRKEKITGIFKASDIPKNAVIIDGIFGTGINKKLPPKVQKLIHELNELPNDIISIDIPSGLSEINQETCIKANITLAMMFPKTIFLDKTKKQNCGRIYVMNFNLKQSDLRNYQFPIVDNDYILLE